MKLILTEYIHSTDQTTITRYGTDGDKNRIHLSNESKTADISISELLSLLQSIDTESTPIRHLVEFTIAGEHTPSEKYELAYDPTYGVYRITENEKNTNLVFTPTALRDTLSFLSKNLIGISSDTSSDGSIINCEHVHRPDKLANTAKLSLFFRGVNKDHILSNGETLCSHNVNVSPPYTTDVVPPEELSENRLAYFFNSNLCSQCRSIAARKDLFTEARSQEPQPPKCPVSGELPSNIQHSPVYGTMLHFNDEAENRRVTNKSYNQWRKGQRDTLEPLHD